MATGTVNLSTAIANLGGALVRKRQGSISSGTPLAIDLAGAGLVGLAHAMVSVPVGTVARTEVSNGGVTWLQYPSNDLAGSSTPYSMALLLQGAGAVTHLRITRISGSGTVDYAITDGPIAWYMTQQTSRGKLYTKTLVVNGTTHEYVLDPANDGGVTWEKFGTANDTLVMRNEAVAPWDRSNGRPSVGVWRLDEGQVELNPPPNNLELPAVSNAAARLALLGVLQNNAVKQNDTGIWYVLTAGAGTGPTNTNAATSGNWTALPAGTIYGAVSIQNPHGVQTKNKGAPVQWLSPMTNLWIKC